MKYLENILEAIGGTPLVKLNKVVGPSDATVLVKCEFLNPGGAIKDRMALHIIKKAEKEGKLKPGGMIVENTSGNTGAGVAMVSALRGYRCTFTMPDKMSSEKVNALKGYGAEVIVTPTNVPAESPQSYYETAKRVARETPGAFYLNQYHNPDNIEAHYTSTGPEIWEQTGGEFDYFVAGLGTGGTMSGAGKFLKEKKPEITNVGVDPIGSVYAGYFKTGKVGTPHVYKVEGIGEDMLCGAMDFSVLDEVRTVDDKQSFLMARRLAREEGLFVGGSSGSAVHAAVQLAKEVGAGKTIVVILPDSGSRYISKFYSDEWMKEHQFLDEEERLGLVRDLMRTNERVRNVISARREESLQDVVERMREHGISQIPVLDDEDRALGMVHEVDILRYVVTGERQPHEKISEVMSPLEGRITEDRSVKMLQSVLADDNVAVVMDGEKISAIINKIDLIEFLSQRMGS